MIPPEPLTAAEIASYIGVSAAAVRQVVRRHKIAPIGKSGNAHTYNPREVLTASGAHDRRGSLTEKISVSQLSEAAAYPGELGVCIYPGCDSPVFIKKRRLCKPHYMTAWQAGAFGQHAAPRHEVHARSIEHDKGTCSLCGPESPVMIQADGRGVCKAGARAERMNRKYRLTPKRLRELFEEAGWRCAICEDPIDESTSHVDHDHACCPGKVTCGKCVRGLLCHRCNVGLGFFREDLTALAAAARYLETRKSMRCLSSPREVCTVPNYGPAHKRLRAAWAPKVATGRVRCARCLELIPAGSSWHLGHVDTDTSRYAGPEHVACNTATAAHRAVWRRLPAETHPGRIT